MTKHVSGADPALVIFDKLEGHIADLSAKFVEIGEKYGPDVINLGLDVVRLTGAAPLFLGLVMVVTIPFLVWLSLHWCKKFREATCYKDEGNSLWGAIPSVILTLVATITAFATLLNFWNWVAVFYPVAYLAKKVMGL